MHYLQGQRLLSKRGALGIRLENDERSRSSLFDFRMTSVSGPGGRSSTRSRSELRPFIPASSLSPDFTCLPNFLPPSLLLRRGSELGESDLTPAPSESPKQTATSGYVWSHAERGGRTPLIGLIPYLPKALWTVGDRLPFGILPLGHRDRTRTV